MPRPRTKSYLVMLFPSVVGSSFLASYLVVVVSVLTSTCCSQDAQRARSEVKNNMRSVTSDTVHGFSVALHIAHQLPLNFTF